VRVVASKEAAALVRAQGGRLYVWAESSRCCRSVQHLRTSAEPSADRPFERVYTGDFELWFPVAARLPAELQIDARRGRVQAYWEGCAWVT
jgi:hypothetical protein